MRPVFWLLPIVFIDLPSLSWSLHPSPLPNLPLNHDPDTRDLPAIEAVPLKRTATQPHHNPNTQHIPKLGIIACLRRAQRF